MSNKEVAAIHTSQTVTNSSELQILRITDVSTDAYYVEKEDMSVDQKLPLSTCLKHMFLTRDGRFGNYDYGALCLPRIPFYKKKGRECYILWA
jgi:hypothetical protein